MEERERERGQMENPHKERVCTVEHQRLQAQKALFQDVDLGCKASAVVAWGLRNLSTEVVCPTILKQELHVYSPANCPEPVDLEPLLYKSSIKSRKPGQGQHFSSFWQRATELPGSSSSQRSQL